MPSEKLYTAAAIFREGALWEQLFDDELFAVRYPNGKTGFCCVMGMQGEFCALSVYMGYESLSTYMMLSNPIWESDFKTFPEEFMIQDCIMCSFDDKSELKTEDLKEIEQYDVSAKKGMWPIFRRYRPLKMPWYIENDEEEEYLRIALLAGAEVTKRISERKPQMSLFDSGRETTQESKESLGFSQFSGPGSVIPMLIAEDDGSFKLSKLELRNKIAPPFPSPAFNDDILAAKLKKNKKHGRILFCELITMPDPLDGNPPSFPTLLVWLDGESLIMSYALTDDYYHNPTELTDKLLKSFQKNGIPDRIIFRQPNISDLLHGICSKLGIELYHDHYIPELEEMREEFLDSQGSIDNLADELGLDEDKIDEFMELLEDKLQFDDINDIDDILPELMDSDVLNIIKKPIKPKSPSDTLRQNNSGTCYICGKEYSSGGMLRHLKSCIKNNIEKGSQQKFIISVKDRFDPRFFLYIEAAANITLKKLDKFLRDTWVECCGHLSAFYIDDECYCSHVNDYDEYDMDYKLDLLFSVDDSFDYVYDFGSSTELRLKVVDEIKSKKLSGAIRVLARNNMPELNCVVCSEPAEYVCSNCRETLDDSVYCEECAEEHKCGMEVMLPLSNSPRCGICGYVGNED